jgi:hypothetical protein
MHRRFHALGKVAILVALAGLLSACVVEEPGAPHGHGWCWWHPGACR